jgi:signal transduction histidine kinase
MTNDVPPSPSALSLAQSLLLTWNYGNGTVTLQAAPAPAGASAAEPLDGHLSRWRQAVHPEDLPSVVESFEAHLRGHSLFHVAEYRILSEPETWLAVRDMALVTTRDSQGTPVQVSMIRTMIASGVNVDMAHGDWQAVRRIGHDLNNLLGAISGYSEMLLEDVRPDQAMFADLDRVHEAAHRASGVAGTLMAIARRRTTAPSQNPVGS